MSLTYCLYLISQDYEILELNSIYRNGTLRYMKKSNKNRHWASCVRSKNQKLDSLPPSIMSRRVWDEH